MEILRKMYYSNMFRYIVTPTIGFGVAGALWGWDIYRGATGSNEAFINPFSFISGAFLFGILGSLSLVIFSGDLKKILKVVGIGTVGWLTAFLVPAIINQWLFLLGGFITLLPSLFFESGAIEKFTVLRPAVLVVDYSFFFFISGILAGFVYFLLFSTTRKNIILFSGFAFAIGAILAPLAGNSIGIALNSSLAAYLITFSLIGGIMGFVFKYLSMKKIDVHDS